MRGPQLLERVVELAAMGEIIGGAVHGRGGLALIEGEAGIGKTSLLDAAAVIGVGRDVRVLRARGGELERDAPFGVVRQLFEPLLRRCDPDWRDRVLSGPAADAAPVLGLDRPAPAADPFVAQHGLYWLLDALAVEQPVLVIVDDAQWSDSASLRWLSFVARRLDGLAVGMLLGWRNGEWVTHPVAGEMLRTDPAIRVLAPAPLSADASASATPAGRRRERRRRAGRPGAVRLRRVRPPLRRRRADPAPRSRRAGHPVRPPLPGGNIMTGEMLDGRARTVIECWNRADWAGYRMLAAPDFTYEEAGTGRRVEGVDAVLAGWGRLRTAFPDAAAEITQVHIERDTTVAAVIWRATQTGPLPGVAGVESPSYKRVQVWDLIAMRWRGGELVAERHNIGFLSLMAPLLDGRAAGGDPRLSPGAARRS